LQPVRELWDLNVAHPIHPRSRSAFGQMRCQAEPLRRPPGGIQDCETIFH
jgi:hypothetical protein